MAGPGGLDMGAVLGEQMMHVANAMEEQVDAEINKMQNMDENDFEALKQQRLAVRSKTGSKRGAKAFT